MEKMNENNLQENPLVSICVISYNSSTFVLETLESAKTQTYQNIELIVSDDGSTDNTIELCKNWLAQNKERFVRTELITVEKNTGIPANCNRALKAANGEWIKLIAADDILMDNCISDNVENVVLNSEINLLLSEFQTFDYKNGNKYFGDVQKGANLKFFDLTANEQYKESLIGNINGKAATLFFKKEVAVRLDYFDEEIPLNEDTPFFIKCPKYGYKFYFLEKPTVLYRFHDKSVHSTLIRNKKDLLINTVWFRNLKVREKYLYPNYILTYRLHLQYDYLIKKTFFKEAKNTKINRILLKLLTMYLNPFHYILFFLHKNKSNDRYWILKKSIKNIDSQ